MQVIRLLTFFHCIKIGKYDTFFFCLFIKYRLLIGILNMLYEFILLLEFYITHFIYQIPESNKLVKLLFFLYTKFY